MFSALALALKARSLALALRVKSLLTSLGRRDYKVLIFVHAQVPQSVSAERCQRPAEWHNNFVDHVNRCTGPGVTYH